MGVGNLSANDAIAFGCTGPSAARERRRLRRPQSLPVFELRRIRFQRADAARPAIATRVTRCAWRKCRESLKIVKQAMEKIPPDGPFRAELPGIIPPAREEMKASIEGLIYHFKIFTEGFAPPPGEVYQCN